MGDLAEVVERNLFRETGYHEDRDRTFFPLVTFIISGEVATSNLLVSGEIWLLLSLIV